ncbi:CARL2 protein, partial [Chauna torquata]|nr:CARL2 protein [Chauna torquata]
MLSDILRAPSKAGEPGKPLSKSEEGALGAEPEHSQTPETARRIRPKYSREGKSQSLILLPGEDEEVLGVRQDKKRHLEKSDGELPNSFEQRVHVMLHRMGVTKGLAAEGKKQQSKDSEIKKAGSDGDIVDSSADSPPSLKARTHSVSTGDVPMLFPADASLRSTVEPSPAWKALGRQLNAELMGPSWEQPRRCSAGPEQSGQPVCREGWSSSLPRPGRSAPLRRVSHGEEPAAGTPLPASPHSGTEDNRLTLRLAAPSGRRAVSIHEEQLREPECLAELGTVTVPLRLRRSPVLKRRPEVASEPGLASEAGGPAPQDQPRAGLEEPQPRADAHGERPRAAAQTVANAQDSAVDQRSPVLGWGEPALGQ